MYATTAPAYRKTGWNGVLPLPECRKFPPPKGVTGDGQPDPTDVQVEDWIAGKPYRGKIDGIEQWITPTNIGIRVPPGVIGYDADLYKAGGRRTHDGLVAECGELPPTWLSTSRIDGSGIRFYRIPAGIKLKGAFGGVEIIQHHHRYAVVAPSINPDTGLPYRIIDPDGCIVDMLPAPELLPELPAKWLKRLQEGPKRTGSRFNGTGSTGSASDFINGAGQVERVLARALETLRSGASRHDATRDAVWSLAHYEAQGHAGAADAIKTLRSAFITAVSDRSGPEEAEAEWDRMVDGAREKIRAPQPPEDFWIERSHLTHIRQAAHARQRSAPAVLHAVLTRLAALAPHTYRLPPIVGASAPLCYYAIGVAHSGVGKSSASAIATELFPFPKDRDVADQLPLGSGEGLAEVLFDLVEEPGPKGRTTKVKRQTRHGAYLYVDEGQLIGSLGKRDGSSLLPTLRTIWTGGVIGQTNASTERKRIVPAGNYVYGVFVGLQPAKAAALLDDADGGTPQRFAWTLATDPTIPDIPPSWPGPIEWKVPVPDSAGRIMAGLGDFSLDVADSIVAEIRATDLAKARGDEQIDALDGHAGLLRLKMAALLGLLDGRLDVNEDDWRLAGVLKDASDAVRTWVVDTVAAAKNENIRQVRSRKVADAVAADEAVERRRIVDCARKIAMKVHAEPDRWTARELLRSLSRYQRDVFAEALAHGHAEGWVIEQTEETPGDDKRVVRPGPRRPA